MYKTHKYTHILSFLPLCSLLLLIIHRVVKISQKREASGWKKPISKLIINLMVESWFIFIFIFMTFSFLFNDISYDDSSLKTMEFLSGEYMSMHVCVCVHMHTCMYKTNLYSVIQIFEYSNMRCILKNSNAIIKTPFMSLRRLSFHIL